MTQSQCSGQEIAIVGGGFTGLSAAYYLSQKGHKTVIYEKEKQLGGLADTYREKGWAWSIEKHYHHWFTNDNSVFDLIRELGLEHKVMFPRTLTSIYFDNKIFPFNAPSHVLQFSPLNVADRFRTGLVTMYLKFLTKSRGVKLEKYTAYEWLKKYYGEKVFKILWEPLLTGKFGGGKDGFAAKVNMAWFWARIKKRSAILGYIEGGYRMVLDKMAEKIKETGGEIRCNSPFGAALADGFDKVIVTAPTSAFMQMFPKLPADYKKRLNNIAHLHALNLLLISKEKILPNDYWLNINDRKFPFLAVVQHTNMADKKYYGGNHLAFICNYLPDNHLYLNMKKDELFKLYLPYLKKVNPSINYQLSTTNYQLFFGSYAQPVFPINYSRIKPDFKTPIKNVYLANMDMVYPWDRGTNYAIEMGKRVADIIISND